MRLVSRGFTDTEAPTKKHSIGHQLKTQDVPAIPPRPPSEYTERIAITWLKRSLAELTEQLLRWREHEYSHCYRLPAQCGR